MQKRLVRDASGGNRGNCLSVVNLGEYLRRKRQGHGISDDGRDYGPELCPRTLQPVLECRGCTSYEDAKAECAARGMALPNDCPCDRPDGAA
jgi:hypothetical protein